MNKILNTFKKLSIPFILATVLFTVGLFAFASKSSKNADAAFISKSTISNEYPDYVDFNVAVDNDAYKISNVGDTIYLFQTQSHLDFIIGNHEISSPAKNPDGTAYTGTNWCYYPNEKDESTYYYFNFTNAPALYYDLTKEDLENGVNGTNLLDGKDIKNYVKSHENPFLANIPHEPEQFNLSFRLNTLREDITFEGNAVILNKEGIYTLVVPVTEYYTTNGGLSFTPNPRYVYYNFMAFNANSYFDLVSGRPNISNSSNVQETSLNASSTYSTYYYYNFSSALNEGHENTLPTINYNPSRFSLNIDYTDLENNTHSAYIEYQDGQLVQLGENGEVLSDEQTFLFTNLDSNITNSASIAFSEIGSYDIHFTYLYKTANGKTYNLDFDHLSSTSAFKNKAQRMYVYGYQAAYSDYSNIDALTNQPQNQDLKYYDKYNHYIDSADITSAVNKYAKKNDILAEELKSANPTSTTEFDIPTLRDLAVNAINNDKIKLVSTNQTPIKFLTNAKNQEFSRIYKVTDNNGTISVDNGSPFQGFNQNDPGIYLYIIQYKFDSFMSTSGTLQSALYHYQMFYFKITNNYPTVSVLDSNFEEVYTNGFTNKNVFILNDTENNRYDAKVTITLSAQDYKTNNYFFKDVNIKELASYGMRYQTFDKSTNAEDEKYNNTVGGRNGILIENNNRYANAKYTIKIASANTNKPSSRTFTIDTNKISNITSRNVSLVSSTTYLIEDAFSSFNTNQPIIFSWDEKASGAMTYGYVTYIPTQSINYYSSQESDNLNELLNDLLIKDILPVSYKIDLENRSQWTEYSNSKDFSSLIQSSYVKSSDGFYILQVYDQAGNSSFEIYLIDSSSPLFVQQVSNRAGDVFSIFGNNDCISVPETGVEVSIKWTANKALKLENFDEIFSLKSYQFSFDNVGGDSALNEKLLNFFNSTTNPNIENVTGLLAVVNDSSSSSVSTGISAYNGEYLVMPINRRAYLKDTQSNNFTPYNGFDYTLRFVDDKGQVIEGTYNILLRDSSNTFIADDESIAYKNHPSGYLTFNVTSDASKLMVLDGEKSLAFSSFSLSKNLYTYREGNAEDGQLHYSLTNYDENINYTESEKMYKYSYYTPINGKRPLKLQYIPVAVNGSVLENVTLYYYKYERKLKQYKGDKNYYYYYDLSETPTQKIDIFKYTEKEYETGKVEEFDLAIGSGDTPLAGKYVIERKYRDNSTTDDYDYFMRFLTLIIDNNNIISPIEAVSDKENLNSSFESVVGGDIIVSLYSGDNNSNIEISFPSYNEAGLSTGTLYTKDSFTENENLSTFSVVGNKLPISLYVPKYKYTISANRKSNGNNGNTYEVTNNDNLSYYGNARYEYNPTTRLYDVYVEDILVESFGREQLAISYLETASMEEYKLKVEVKATVKGNTRYYYSDGTTENGYLKLYLANGRNGKIDKSKEMNYFYEQGNYVVTLYQASNIGTTSNFYLLYKFGFEILSQSPDFEIIDADGYNLTATNTPNVYYTNSNSLKIQWEVPKSQFMAQIDETNITVTSFPSSASFTRSDIVDETTSKYFTIDTSSLLNVADSYIRISMQYYGHNSTYYSTITKTIYFDKAMPMQNLQNLMAQTQNATNAFTTNYQLVYMRQYFDYNGREVEVDDIEELKNISYSYSLNNGQFKYYSYSVTSDFFNDTLKSTIAKAANDPRDTQFIYYRFIENLNYYMQVDKSSFSAGNYYYISPSETLNLALGFYEIVEMDYAGNMVVYIVQLSSTEDENDLDDIAISYNNSLNTENIEISNKELSQGYNIYSNSGFELNTINYHSDAWGYFTVKLAGESEYRFMKSPWLDSSQAYRLTFTSNGVNFSQESISSIFEGVTSSEYKHRLTLTDRTAGNNINVYISVMDASLSTQKVADPTKTSAILNISVPTPAQQASTTLGYIYPVNIKIYQFDNLSIEENKWRQIMVANQLSYGTWTPTEEFTSALSYISFKTLAGQTTLQVSINLGANATQKVKYDITDNFGNVTTVIQLANEVSYKEISGEKSIYEFAESDGTITYLSSDKIFFSYNILLYSAKVLDSEGIEVTNNITQNLNGSTNIMQLEFAPSKEYFFDEYYKVIISDIESDSEVKSLQIRLYNKLPFRTSNSNEVLNGGIIFNDKNQQPIDEKNIGTVPNSSIVFDGRTYVTTADYITTFSYNVTLRYFDGQSLAYEGRNHYQDGYTYSVYLSKDNGQTWENINNVNSDVSGYTITGVGDYIIFIKYDSEELFNEQCRLYYLSILDSSSSYYYITVDGLTVEKSDVKYTSLAGQGYEMNYIVSVDYSDKDNRLKITTNEELNVKLSRIGVDSTGSNVTVEIYRYECSESAGDFTIIYIAETNNIISTFTYETSTGTTSSIKDTSSIIIVANRDTETSFDKLKINFSSYYGIKANKINVETSKLFNGSYVTINSKVYTNELDSFVYLNEPGTYRLKIYDSCSPANIQTFKGSKYIDIIFLSYVPFTVTSTNDEGESVITEPINKAVYNSSVVIRPTYLSSYYQASQMPTIQVKRNGRNYSGYTQNNYTFTFTDTGYYTVTFSATSITGIPVRTQEYNFTIVNKNESRYAFEYTQYDKYYIQKVEKNGVDITSDLLEIGNFPTITINDRKFLSGITLNYLDDKTGGGRYTITICPNNSQLINTIGESFTFGLWINMANPPINVSLPEGEKSTKNITVSFNVANLYNAVGDCYLQIGSLERHYNAGNISSYGTNETITITGTGTFYVQLYTESGHLLFSYKVTKSEPLNVFAIIAIIIGVIAAGAVIGITIALRKRQKVK